MSMTEKRITAKEKKEASRRDPIDFSDPKNKPQVCNMFGCREKVENRSGLCKTHFYAKALSDGWWPQEQ